MPKDIFEKKSKNRKDRIKRHDSAVGDGDSSEFSSSQVSSVSENDEIKEIDKDHISSSLLGSNEESYKPKVLFDESVDSNFILSNSGKAMSIL